MRIAIVSDACDPPTNGVSQTLTMICAWLERFGHEVRVVSPPEFPTLPCPSQPDIRLAVAPGRRMARLVEAFDPDAIHLATEGPIGLAARRLCLRRGWRFTTMFTTKFGEAIHARFGVPAGWTYRSCAGSTAPPRRSWSALRRCARIW